jgi:hypothetical protein
MENAWSDGLGGEPLQELMGLRGPRPTTRFETSFDLRVGSHRVVVGAILPWQCRGSKLKTL